MGGAGGASATQGVTRMGGLVGCGREGDERPAEMRRAGRDGMRACGSDEGGDSDGMERLGW